jgi:beta-galactosidase GanA
MTWTTQTLGVCYHPEQWPEDMWTGDARRMREAGIAYARSAWGTDVPDGVGGDLFRCSGSRLHTA